jgi:PKHD-type hydroxylase
MRVFPPLFNRYDEGMGFGAHVDNAIRHVKQAGNLRIRTDQSATLFLTDPADYDGGELVIEDSYGEQRVKLAAGDMVLYPACSLHRVEAITRGSRWAAFFWIQSMVRDDGERSLLYGLDQAIRETRTQLSDDSHAVKSLTATYHNLLRRWAEV